MPSKFMPARLIPLLALVAGLSACREPGATLVPSSDPNINAVLFSQVQESEAHTDNFTAELVTSALAPAPGQDFLTINITPGLTNTTRLLNLSLRAPSDQIKTGASFPLGKDGKPGTATLIYQESVSIVVNHAYQASAGSLIIDKILGTTNLSVEFHLKDARMEPAQTSNGVLDKGSFMINLHGLPTR
ncbi:MAG TPA: hypothetical protein V6D23_08120 [Candidatus Obscuribacterales bacterium]